MRRPINSMPIPTPPPFPD
jgi:hypothetical protein